MTLSGDPTSEGGQGIHFARIGYEGYAKQTGGKTFDGREMPEWDDLPNTVKMAWAMAASEILKASGVLNVV